MNYIRISGLMLLALWLVFSLAAKSLPVSYQTNILEIKSMTVGDKFLALSNETSVHLSPYAKNIFISFGPETNSSRVPIRLHYKLDGYDNSWKEDHGEVCLAVRYFDESRNQIGQNRFDIDDHNSLGWRKNLNDSSLTHRRESVVVPQHASRLMIVIASTGAPSNVGVYVITDLTVSKIVPNGQPEILLQFPAGSRQDEGIDQNDTPNGWVRDGTHPSMAKITELGDAFSSKKAFMLLDDDPLAHAEWHNAIENAPKVKPGDHIVIEWNEMYDIADSLTRIAGYRNLPPGNYVFRVAELNVFGIPTGVEAALPIFVSQPAWRRPWFWVASLIGFSVTVMAGVYYFFRRKMRVEILRLENQRILEQERLRIAKDIHDDLGARVTLISMVSAMAHSNPIDPARARVDFEQISEMARDLVAALYETVWAVNPANDNLKELGNYLSQLANKLCAKTQCRCRFYVDDLPREIMISSHTRHNICMAVKEALHNVIKHANATEVSIRITFKELLLDISIQDDGCGFQMTNKFTGAGLNNLKQRLNDIGGNCVIESRPGQGTMVCLRLKISKADHLRFQKANL